MSQSRQAAPRHIVVGFDGSQTAVLDFALAEAARCGCALRVVHAYTVPAAVREAYHPFDVLGQYEGMTAAYETAAKDVLAAAQVHIQLRDVDVDVDYAVTRGPAVDVLGDEADTAVGLVIGTDKPRPWYLRALEGRIARHLVKHAATPVAVVPGTWVEPSTPGTIVLSLDGETSARGPLRYAFEAAGARHSHLQILHTQAARGSATGADPSWLSHRGSIEAWSKLCPDVSITIMETAGDIKESLTQTTREAALLVIGQPRSHELGMVHATVAEALIAATRCPVVVVPEVRDRPPSLRHTS